jgi:mannan endo-1,4-beta-mannosidase
MRASRVAGALLAIVAAAADAQPVDAHATAETRALFANLRRLAGTQIMFGHQDDLAYGHDWFAQPGAAPAGARAPARSDVKDVAGAYPAVYGWELGNLERGMPADLDGVDFARMRDWIVEGYRRGGVITLSWHMMNPATGGSAWDTAGAPLATILPGGANH